MTELNFILNGKKINIKADESKRLVDVLRENLGLTGTKEGCGIGECGACTVIIDGNSVNSCLVLASQINGSNIETIENLERDDVLSNLQKAFLENGAIQCGYCTPGMLMSAKALLDKNSKPTIDEIKTALEGNLCRCTGYIPIIDSINAVVEKP
jgi:aerobic carbon-monoxide dehydrogenase small subunit